MSEVSFWIHAESKFFPDVSGEPYDYFESIIKNYLRECYQYNDIRDKVVIVTNTLRLDNEEDDLDLFIKENIKISFDFANNLKLYDIVNPACFSAENEKGLAFINFMEYIDIRFVLKSREFKSSTSLKLDFVACHCDCVEDVQKVLIANLLAD